MRSKTLALALVLVLCCRWARADSEPPLIAERRTAHYDLYVEGIDADVVAELIESEYATLAKFFGRAPRGRLAVKIFSSHERYAAAIKALPPDEAPAAGVDAQRTLDAWGKYNNANKTAYVTVVEGPCGTRQMILHECVHQFHFLACCDNASPKSAYYAEGLAEHFGVHRWNGRSAEPGAVPVMIASRDDPGDALTDLYSRHQGGPRALATDTGDLDLTRGDPGYGAAWGLVSFLCDRHPQQFHRWAAALDAQAEPAAAWNKAFGAESDATTLTKEYEAWLLAHQEPWKAICGDWQNTDDHTFEAATPLPRGKAFAVIKAPVSVLKASVALEGERPRGGVILGCTSDHDYMVLFVSPSGYLRLETMKDGKWAPNLPINTIRVQNGRKFSLEVSKSGVGARVRIDGHPALAIEVPADSRIGFALGEGTATFTSIESH